MLDQVLDENGEVVVDVKVASKLLRLLRLIKIARSFRIFKLARHFEGVQVLGYTFKAKRKEFTILIVYLFIGLFIFSALVQPLEEER